MINSKSISPEAHKSIHQLEKVVCDVLGVSVDTIRSKSPGNMPARARFAIFMLLYEKCGMSKLTIGQIYGKDYTTVAHGIQRAKDLGFDKTFSKTVDNLRITKLFNWVNSPSAVDKTGD